MVYALLADEFAGRRPRARAEDAGARRSMSETPPAPAFGPYAFELTEDEARIAAARVGLATARWRGG